MKADKLSSFALAIAAVILLVVGAISYRDYLKAKYEKEFGVNTAQSAGSSQGVGTAPPPPQSQANAAAPAPNPVPPPPANIGQIPPMPNLANPQTGAATAQTGEQALSPIQAAAESRLSQYQKDLQTLQQENAIYREKLAETQNGTGPGRLIPEPVLPPAPGAPASAVAAVSPAANPAPPVSPLQQQQLSPQAVEQEVRALAEKIRREASVAKVVEFDPEWAFLVISGGRDRGIQREMRFAVRRGSEILGWVKITEVEETRAVAQLMSNNKDSQTARKPEPGDDIIAFNLF